MHDNVTTLMSSFLEEANMVGHNLAKVAIYNTSSQLYFDIPPCIDSLIFNEMYQFSLVKKKEIE